MIANLKLFAVLSTTNLERAKKFYGETLGLKLTEKNGTPDGHLYFEAGGGTGLVVYQRPEAPKAENTVAGFEVDDIEAVMKQLRENGVTFEEYDYPNFKTVNGVATMGSFKSSWFKDPDGNIVALNQIS